MEALLSKPSPGALVEKMQGLAEILDWMSISVELVAILVFVVGVARFLWDLVRGHLPGGDGTILLRMRAARAGFRLYILAGLDLFIVSDIIHTAVTLALSDLLFLGLLVAIRMGVGISLERAAMKEPELVQSPEIYSQNKPAPHKEA